MGVGASLVPDSSTATRQAIESAICGRRAVVVVLFSSPTHDLRAVAQAPQDAAGNDVLVVGRTTSGEITGLDAGSGRLVAVAIGSDGFSVRTSVGMLADGARKAERAAAQCVVGLDRPHQVLMLLSGGLAGQRADMIRGACGVAGAAVPLVGGCAGDELAMAQIHQIFGGEVLTGAVIGVAIGSEGPLGIGVGHGWRRSGEPVVVTESDGQRIFQFNDEPALDFYLHAVGASPEVFENDALWRLTALWHPIGLPRPGGEEVRAVLGADFNDRSLICGDVPQGTVIWMMEGDADSVMAGTRTACEQALGSLGGAAPLGIIAFDCAARRAILGAEGIQAEMVEIAAHAPGVPVGGFYTYDEFARRGGSRGVHNTTLALLAFA